MNHATYYSIRTAVLYLVSYITPPCPWCPWWASYTRTVDRLPSYCHCSWTMYIWTFHNPSCCCCCCCCYGLYLGHIKSVVRAIEVSHAACKDEFRWNPRPHSWRFLQSPSLIIDASLRLQVEKTLRPKDGRNTGPIRGLSLTPTSKMTYVP